ncbi:MAG: L-threonylcarbamoyladenylate synthase, partial [Desulfobulbia bacterium]
MTSWRHGLSPLKKRWPARLRKRRNGSLEVRDRETVAQSLVTEEALAQACAVLRSGGVVAFPTETYYGLAVDPFNQAAVS